MRARREFILMTVAMALLAVATARADNETNGPQTEKTPAQSGQPQTPPPAGAKEPAPPASVTVIEPKEAHGVLGRDVRSPTGEDMGHIVDVIVDRAGVVRAAVI